MAKSALRYLRAGGPGHDDIVAVEEQRRHGRLITSRTDGGGQCLEDTRIAVALVNVHVVDVRLMAGRKNRLVLQTHSTRKSRQNVARKRPRQKK